MATKTMRLAALVICATITVCFQYFGVDGLSAKYLRHRRAVEEDDCVWEVSGSGTLNSPGYPANYPGNADCHWLINADEPGATIALTIHSLDIEHEEECRLDYLRVYSGPSPEGPPLKRFCGSIRGQVVETNASQILLEFHSDAVYEEKGFSIEYITRHSSAGCQETIAEDSGSLRSPGSPNSYPDDVDCWTLITVGEDKKVRLTFDTVELEYGENCTFDYVEVFDGDTKNASVLARLCQEKEEKSFESTSRSLLVHFHSDDSVSRKGYLANFKAIPQGGCLWEPGDEGGTISSPGHPGDYPSATNCSVMLVAPEGSSVAFDIETLKLELDANCSFDFITITEGTPPDIRLLGRFCGLRSEPTQVESKEREVRVRFESDSFVEFSGFKLQYRFVRKAVVDEGSPSFNVTPGNVSVPEGSSAVLPCNTRHPNARIRWLKGETFLAGESPLPGLRILSNGSLWIESMRLQLAGAYTCVAVWPEGQMATEVHVNMGEDGHSCRVEFRRRPSDSEFEEGEFAHLECLADGPLRWLKDGRPFETDDRVTVVDNGYVFVPRVSVEDAGTYTCVADGGNGCVGKAAATLKVTPKASIQDVCGVSRSSRKVSQSEHGKIVGGSDAREGAYPWQVMLWNPAKGPFCGATLLNERWVVTAAHCVDNSRDVRWDTLRLLLGKHERARGEESEVESHLSGPTSLVVHPEFRKFNFDNDVALIRMARPVRFSDRVLPVCLAERNVTESLLRPSEMGVVIGWGRLKENGAYPRFLQEIRLPVVEQERCKASTNFSVTRNMFCAGYSQDVIGDACYGDSGGPFLVSRDGRWHLVGVVSWGDGCGQMGKYGFYTRIAHHLAWIQSVIKS